jgi:sporulation protein YlmC with PRC-barrel domain
MRLSSLLGKDVVTETGWPLGRILDVRVELNRGAPTVQGFLVGSEGLRERLLGESKRQDVHTLDRTLVPWDAVLEITAARVKVKEIPLPTP